MLKRLFFSAVCLMIFSTYVFADQTTFSASLDSKLAKAGLKSQWKKGDRIAVYFLDVSNIVRRTGASATQDGSNVSFVADSLIMASKYVAVYPEDRKCTFASGDIEQMQIDWNASASSLEDAQIYVAQSSSGNLVFKCVNAILKFSTDSPEMMMAAVSDGTHRFTAAINGAGAQYIAVPSLKSATISVRLCDSKGSRLPSYVKALKLKPAKIFDLGDIENAVKSDGKKVEPYFRLMSFNILRGDLDGPEHLWKNRREACLKMLETDRPDILGLQECNSVQLDDILAANPRFGAVGQSVKGEKYVHERSSANPIFYDGSKFLLEDWGTFWLSSTPDTVSNTWHYNKPRTATWARLKVKGTDKRLVYVCVHLQDNKSSIKSRYKGQEKATGSDNRTKAVSLIVSRLSLINPQGYPILFSGDLNCRFNWAELAPLYGPMSLVADKAKYTDKGNTFNGYASEKGKYRIDHIFSDKCTHSTFTVERNNAFGVPYISDHWPVYTDFTLD